MLAIPVDLGSQNRRRLALVHGFSQSGESWRAHAESLAETFHVVAADLPGHGATDPAFDAADLWETADLLAGLGPASFVGYSLGARAALHLALASPRSIEALILVGAKGGIDDAGERAYRRASDEAASERLERDGIEAFVDGWLAQPFNQRLPADRQGRSLRLAQRAGGLASSLRHCGSGAQEPLWDRLSAIDVPVLVVHGEHDLPHVITDAHRLVEAIGPNAECEVVPDSGHAVPFERPDEFLQLVQRFLARVLGNSPSQD